MKEDEYGVPIGESPVVPVILTAIASFVILFTLWVINL